MARTKKSQIQIQQFNLLGEAFSIEETSRKKKLESILNKIDNPKDVTQSIEKRVKSKTISEEEKLALIKSEVERVLGRYKPYTLVISSREQLHSYIDKAISNGIIAIDTETNNSLDPLTCLLMGGCIYTPGEKNVYIPVNHIDRITRERLPWQLNENDIREEFQRLIDANVFTLWHNGKFDYKVIHCTCHIDMPICWDSYVGARLLDENEPSAGLKQQYVDKIDNTQEEYHIDELFENVEYAIVPPEIFALYAATDAYETYKLYEYQKKEFEQDNLQGVFHIFKNIEMPLVTVVAKMELEGIDVDLEYANRLSKKYHKLSDECNQKVEVELSKLNTQIENWKSSEDATKKTVSKTGKEASKSKLEQLSDPIDINSPTQLAILVYDILKAPQVSTKSPRGTGVDELTALKRKTKWPIFDLILEKRTLDKLLNTFVDALPQNINPATGKIHTQLLPLGTDTGRFSSKQPNLQQIPRANIEIKPMFKAPQGYSLICCDLSAAEVRTATSASQDPDMIKAYCDGQDLYSLIASKIYKNNYEDNLEFYPEGTEVLVEGKPHICKKKEITNKSGKVRRQDSKSVLIGLIYGRGVQSIMEQINETRLQKGGELITKQDAQNLVDNIYKSFPRLKQWMEETHDWIHKYGYIDDCFGRRRRLPDGQLPRYTIKVVNDNFTEFNPFLECEDKADEKTIKRYEDMLKNIHSQKEYEDIKKAALAQGVEIHDNTGYISQAERQSVNFQAQAASSDINKMSMIAIDSSEELKALGVQLLLTIHDEVMVKCPSENAEKVAEIIPNIMINVGRDKMKVPLVADATIIRHWYEDDLMASMNETFNKLIKGDESKGILPLTKEEAINKIIENHSELLPEQIKGIFEEGKDYLWL